ncbi:MAG TPA: YCF48-related protein [Gemmatimonadales bacterium]|nr:YCF48-related protein [Gemmatimonadales bacterium]
MTVSFPLNAAAALFAVMLAGVAIVPAVPGPRSPAERHFLPGGADSRQEEPRTGDTGLLAQPVRLTPQNSGTTALLQAISVVDDKVVWVSGHQGTWARTLDGGKTWTPGKVPDADTLQFRDVQAFSADEAFLMAAGPGDMSRVYHTTDGGNSWTLQLKNRLPKGFYDCFAFWDRTHGILLSDQVDGRTVMLETTDGETWDDLSTSRVPSPAGTEGGFAASGTCLITLGSKLGWVATGAGTAARVFITTDRGSQWTAVTTPLAAGATAGLTTVAFRDDRRGTALGGDVARNDDTTSVNVAITTDGGKTWKAAGRVPFPGAVFGSAYVADLSPPALMAVGPGGMARSDDDGRHWNKLDTLAYWSVGFGKGTTGWAVGPKGRITRIDLER